MKNKALKSLSTNKSGFSIVELIIVTILFAIIIPGSLSLFLEGRKISGQSYVQNEAALTLGETNDIIRYLRNLDFNLIENGTFFLIRNPGSGSWLVKNDLPDFDLFERQIVVADAERHTGTNHLYMPGDSGPSYTDPDTKKVDINIIWSADYLPLEASAHTVYVTNWQKVEVYDS